MNAGNYVNGAMCEVIIYNKVLSSSEYGCPVLLENGYRMDQWDLFTKAEARNEWGFYSPESRLDKNEEELRSKLTPGYSESSKKPDDWGSDNKKLEIRR